MLPARRSAFRVKATFWFLVCALLVPAAAEAQTPPTYTDPFAPPPPPPPPAGVIQPAAPFERGKAVVLTAEVSGPVERLEWTLDGRSGIVGTIVGGALQRSVRFRPRGRTFTATVQAVGPGGTRSFSRTFTSPAEATGENATRVERGLTRAGRHRVYAAGYARNLTRQAASCGTTTIWAGSQRISGCFSPVDQLADIPAAERGVLEPLARALGLEATSAPLMRTAVELSDGYVGRGSATLNGLWPVIPNGNAGIVVFYPAKVLASSNAALQIAGARFGISGGFVLRLDPARQDIPLGNLTRPGSLAGAIGGLNLIGSLDVTLGREQANIAANLKLPSFVKKAGVDIQSSAALRATPTVLIVDDVTIGPIGVNIGALSVEDFQIAYARAQNEWAGQGKACVVGACLDMVPPNGGVTIRNGRLAFAGATLQFPDPGIPLFAGVNLQRIGFGVGLDPTRFTGNAGLAFGKVVVIDGRLVLAFPTAQAAFVLSRNEVGEDFAAQLYRNRYTRTTLGISAAATLNLSSVGEVPLGKAYVLYEYPGYLALGGSMAYRFNVPRTNLELISASGRLNGELNAANGRFNIDGSVRGCVVAVICATLEGNVATRGMSVCATTRFLFFSFAAGAAIRWSPFEFTPYLAGCVWGRYRDAGVRGVRAAQAGAPYVVRMEPDAPNRLIMLHGDQAAPGVRVSGPGGQVLESPAGSELTASRSRVIRILRSEEHRFVAVALADAPAGTYRIEPLQGSAPIARIRESTALPPARASGRVSGRDTRRVLSYNVRRRPNQTVTFLEIAAGGAARQIGRIRGGGRGSLRFSPAPGRGMRRIEAQFELDGVPAEDIVVARFRPPSPVLRRPTRLRVRRQRANLRVSWARVRGAARYEVAVTQASGLQRFRTTRAPRILLRRVPRTSRGVVSVRAVDRLRQGLVARKSFRRTARPRSSLKSLGRCRVVRRKVVCRAR